MSANPYDYAFGKIPGPTAKLRHRAEAAEPVEEGPSWWVGLDRAAFARECARRFPDAGTTLNAREIA